MKKIILYLILTFSSIGFSQNFTGVNVFDIQQTTAQVLVSATTPSNLPCTIQLLYALSPTSAGAGTSIIHSSGSFTGSTQVTFSLTGLQAGSRYNYVVRLLNPTDNSIRQTNLPNSFNTAAVPAVIPVISNVSSGTITATGAIISYSINPNGFSTSPVIKYGVTSTNLNLTENCTAVTGTTVQAQTQALSGLTANTQYFYRVEASSSAGNATPSATQSFTTSAAPASATITQSYASNIQATTTDIIFSVDPANTVVNAELVYALAPTLANQGTLVLYPANPIAATQSPTGLLSFSISGLTPSSTYNFRVRLKNPNTGAFVSISNSQSFVTTANSLPVITGVGSSSITVNSAIINYTINANGASTSPFIKYGLSSTNLNLPQNGTAVTGTTAQSQTQALSGLTANTQYFYRVEASNSAGNATPSAILSFTTLAPAITAPSISNISVSNLTSNSVRINYTINANNAATTTQVLYARAPSGANPVTFVTGPNATGNANTNLFVDISGLQPDTAYVYSISAVNSAGPNSSSVLNFTTAPQPISATPTATTPQSFCSGATVASLTATGTNLKWYSSNSGGAQLAANTVLAQGLYYVSQTTGTNAESARFAVQVNITTVAVPTIATTAATCSNGGTATIANYSAALTYTSTPAGATVGSNGQIFVNTAGTAYTFVARNASNCASNASASFTIAAQLPALNAPTLVIGTQCFGATIASVTPPGVNVFRWYNVANGGSQLATNTVLATGNYYVSLVNSGGCESTRTTVPVTVTTIAAPTGDAVQIFTTANNTVANLVAAGSAVQWFATNANALSNTNPLAATTAVLNGSVYYAMQTVNGCRSTTPLAVTATVSLSISEFNNLEVSLYPSPVQDILNLEMASDLKSLEIYNLQGQKVKTSTLKRTNVSDLAAGMYLIRVEDTNNAVKTMKIVKQ